MEIKANQNLQRQGFNTLLPLVAPPNKNSKFKSLVPVFPRYLYAQIKLEFDNYSSIKSGFGVSHIVMFSEKFTYIQNSILKLIQGKLKIERIYKEDIPIADCQKGDQVLIKEGGFVGLDAVFLSEKSNDRVSMLLKLLNTSVVTEITSSNI